MKYDKLLKIVMNRKPKDWFKMQVKDDVADIYIYDEIGWLGVNATDFVRELNQIKSSKIKLHLHSPGGNLFDGIAIYNALKQHKAKVDVYIEGLAASSASLIALAGDKVYMAKNSFFMIHNPYVLTIGNSAELRKMADTLDKFTDVMVQTYKFVSGKEEQQIIDWLNDETWFTAEEAKENGFIDEITNEVDIEAKYDLSVYDNTPDELLAELQKNSKPAKPKSQTEPKEPDESEMKEQKQLELMRMRLELENINESAITETEV